jgi:squamous cell carcinoma antigen recognized by T-cells 3
MFPNVPSIPHNQSTPRSSVDLKMTDLSNDTSQPKNFAGTSLSEADQKLATQLTASLAENPYSYEIHRQLCKLLHQGFITHVYPPDSPESHGDPHKYDLLGDLRSARAAMSRQYSVGHDLFTEWIQDESLLARTLEERLQVMELCQKSIEEEYGCTKLWRTYGEWMLYLYNAVSQPDDADGVSSGQEWSEEDKLVGREVFSWSTVLEVWQRAAETTKWRMHDSHLVWDRYMELLLQDLAQTQLPESAARIKLEFERRLHTPHATWEETFQTFSTFISSRAEYNANYEEMMVTTKNQAKDALAAWRVREMREIPLARAAEAGESAKQYNLFLEYLEWSVQPTVKKRAFGGILANALFERAVLYFPTDTYFWQEYAYYVIDESQQGNQVNMSTFGVLERATRHCPWSGSLWSQYLLSSESADRTFTETEEIKHKATSTGLLDQGGMEEVLKVLTAWCSYLRRRAFQPEATDEELDIAEMGIRSSIESLQKLGESKYGESYKGDPCFRLERIYIKYLCESGSWDNARETYKGLVATRGDSHDFWLRYYVFEMIAWGKFIQGEDLGDASSTGRTPPPSYATAVLKQALQRPNLDWPERIAETLLSHCEDYEDVDELQLAVVEVNRANKRIAKRREKEAADTALLAQQQQQADQKAALAKELEDEPVVNGKRKRDPSDEADKIFHKRSKPEDEEQVLNDVQMEDQAKNAESVLKRDRENASIMVKHLPANVSETRIRQFFRDVCRISSRFLSDTNFLLNSAVRSTA